MPNEVYDKLLAAYEQLTHILNDLSEKRVLVKEDGISLRGYSSPDQMREMVIAEIDSYLDKLEELSFVFADDELGGLKNLTYKKLKKVECLPVSEIKNPNIKPHADTYKHFRRVQKELRNYFTKAITEDRDLNRKSEKFVWLGTQRQLAELFEVLAERNWIHFDLANSHMPIVEMFDIKQQGKNLPLKEDSFRGAWKIKSGLTRKAPDYQPMFEKIPRNPKDKNSK